MIFTVKLADTPLQWAARVIRVLACSLFRKTSQYFTTSSPTGPTWQSCLRKVSCPKAYPSYCVLMICIAGKLDGVFLADVLGGYDVYKGSLDPALSSGAQYPYVDDRRLFIDIS